DRVRTGHAGRRSAEGTLAYVEPTHSIHRSIVTVDRQGELSPFAAGQKSFATPRLSPDGKGLATVVRDNGQFDVWVQESASASPSRLTFGGAEMGPIWTLDGREITFSTVVDGKPVIVAQE